MFSDKTNKRIEAVMKQFKEEVRNNPDNEELRTIYSQERSGTRNLIILTVEQVEEFTRCWTDDSTVRFYEARAQFPQYWYVAKGVLVGINGTDGRISWITGSKKNKDFSRLKFDIKGEEERTSIFLSFIYHLTMGTADISKEAEKAMKQMALQAFGNRIIAVHHIKGHKNLEGENYLEYEKQNRDIQILTRNEHEIVHAMGKINRIYQDNPKAITRIAKKTQDSKTTCIVYEVIDRETGRVIEQGYSDITPKE